MTNPSNTLNLTQGTIALISCDSSAYAGNLNAITTYQAAINANTNAIVWYSTQADWCQLSSSQSYAWIYSMRFLNDTTNMLNQVSNLSKGNEPVYMSLNLPEAQVNNTGSNGGSNTNQNSQQSSNNPLGPSPSTAVAMIILYSITGVITALFLVIIVTGAVRAHRHPERYGPRNLLGRPRQSRARGLARAMLDSLPIVKVGERVPPKDGDIELAADATSSSHVEGESDALHPPADGTAETVRPSADIGGIAAARTAAATAGAADIENDNLGCSICTEDFELGQDQRVLPCDHRYHPACIDPWLLNVSGTCPLCRIDLRPQQTAAEPELDENGDPVTRLAPPLDGEVRPSVRRSFLFSLMGLGQPDRMTREERLEALRQYRADAAARERQVPAGEAAREESGRRERMRRFLGVRTRRAGVDEVPASVRVERS